MFVGHFWPPGSTDPSEPADPQPWLKHVCSSWIVFAETLTGNPYVVSLCCRETHNIVEERRVKEEEKSVYEEVEDHDDLFFVQNYDTQADLPHNMKVGIEGFFLQSLYIFSVG
jgi:hypothetical protein